MLVRVVLVLLAAFPVGSGGAREIADPGAGVRDDDDGVGVPAPSGEEKASSRREAQVAGGCGRGGVETVAGGRGGEEMGEEGGRGRHGSGEGSSELVGGFVPSS